MNCPHDPEDFWAIDDDSDATEATGVGSVTVSVTVSAAAGSLAASSAPFTVKVPS